MARSRPARVAKPNIAEVLAQFLAEQRGRLAPRTFAHSRTPPTPPPVLRCVPVLQATRGLEKDRS